VLLVFLLGFLELEAWRLVTLDGPVQDLMTFLGWVILRRI